MSYHFNDNGSPRSQPQNTGTIARTPLVVRSPMGRGFLTTLPTNPPLHNPDYPPQNPSTLTETTLEAHSPMGSELLTIPPANLPVSNPERNDQNNTREIAKVSVKPPPFWKANPDLWFISLEAQFQVSGITQDATRYNIVISSLDSEYLIEIRDIVMAPPQIGKYEVIKKRLISRYSESEEQRLTKLLQPLQLGDNRPSQLLHRMLALAGDMVDESIVQKLWLRRLPSQIRLNLSISQQRLEALSEIADKMHEAYNQSEIYEVKENSQTTTLPNDENLLNVTSSTLILRREIEALNKKVENLELETVRSHYRGRSQYRSKSPFNASRTRSSSRKYDPQCKDCWYHWRFGERATACRPPCSFSKHSENSKAGR